VSFEQIRDQLRTLGLSEHGAIHGAAYLDRFEDRQVTPEQVAAYAAKTVLAIRAQREIEALAPKINLREWAL